MITPVTGSNGPWSLHGVVRSRQREQTALAQAQPHALMAAAGLAVARLAVAIAPHAQTVWVAAGPGNNGGDGLVAARHLLQAGKRVQLSLLGQPDALPDDARQALQEAQQAGVSIESGLPARVDAALAIDALLGIGASRAPQGDIALAIGLLNGAGVPVLAIDLPSGLSADTGCLLGTQAVRAAHTLSLLTLKPGLFTAFGRDHAGTVWLDALGVESESSAPDAWLAGPPVWPARAHAQHKGSFGDVLVIGGAPGMGGAAVLAARAALTAGAGRVYLARLDGAADGVDAARPELMPRALAQVLNPQALQSATVVCGCGGGDAVREPLAAVLHHAARLVLDADALNAIATEPALADALRSRAARGLPSVLTPHPLEAARLLAMPTSELQSDRLHNSRRLSDRLRCGVLLKGSGSVIAAVGAPLSINPTGNARLGTAGSGDVLAGWIGGLWAQLPGTDGRHAADSAAWLHGRAAEQGDLRLPLRAADLIEQMAAAMAAA
ncbi:NAD(P)H-hydrate dehydratase [Aquabacterium sp.]|uniref:NAD(P)H-hydrate dehydratase n=1 Tax=Aquabacterium sp. TaxID=1872578 RepID=UPI002B6C0053|nr:NAD(P)H-hydrate dehydratase [Aquabacterium sp.]HSW05761.1 NAD(P)H-hydrate dehydratase [Aquabacterium sp.]